MGEEAGAVQPMPGAAGVPEGCRAEGHLDRNPGDIPSERRFGGMASYWLCKEIGGCEM